MYLYQNITWYTLNRNSFLFCQLYLKKAGVGEGGKDYK